MLVDERLALLRISEVHLSDEGNYACVVKSKGHADVISANAHLYVESKRHALIQYYQHFFAPRIAKGVFC